MSSLIAAFLLAMAPPDDATVKELSVLTQKLKEAESYTFEFHPRAHAAAPAAKPAADGAAKKNEAEEDEKEPIAWKVEIQKKSPWHYVHGDVEMYRHEMLFAVKNKEGKWSRVGGVPNQRRAPGATAGGAPAKGEDDGDDEKDGKKPEGGEKGGRQNRRGAQRLASAAEAIPLAHQFFYDFEKRVSDVTKDAKPAANGETVYVATLTPAAARELANEGRSLRMGEGRPNRGGGDGKEPKVGAAEHAGEATATLRIGVKDGAIASVEVETTSRTPAGEHQGGGRITISNVNATKIVVPPEATALFAPPAAPHDGGGPEKK